jgi:hypothetical protein
MSKYGYDVEILGKLSEISPFTFNDVTKKIPDMENPISLIRKYQENGILKSKKIQRQENRSVVNQYTISDAYKNDLKKNLMRINL